MSLDEISTDVDYLETPEEEMLRLVQAELQHSVGVEGEETPEEEMLRLVEKALENTTDEDHSAIETRDISDQIFGTIQLTLHQAIKRMGGRAIILDADATNDTSAESQHEVVHLSAGAAIALVTGAKVAHFWSELQDPDQREKFRQSTMEELARELEAVFLNYHALFQNPIWRAVFVRVVTDERMALHTADELARGFDDRVLRSNRKFAVEVYDEDDEQIATIASGTLQQWERIKQENKRIPLHLAEPIYPFESHETVALLYSRVTEILPDQSFDIMYPSGNTTLLMEVTKEQLQSDRENLTRKATQLVEEGLVEQVGFYYQPDAADGPYDHDVVLTMSGDEFCLNATLSVAARIHERTNPNHAIKVQCSGGALPISCKCSFNLDHSMHVRATYPVQPALHPIKGGNVVLLPGIAHIVMDVEPKDRFDEDGIGKLKALMAEHGDLIADVPAVGLIQLKVDEQGFEIDPTVHVRDTNTFVEETACGSGTAAATAVMRKRALERGDDREDQWHAAQPSGNWFVAEYKEKRDFATPAIVMNATVKRVCSSSDLHLLS